MRIWLGLIAAIATAATPAVGQQPKSKFASIEPASATVSISAPAAAALVVPSALALPAPPAKSLGGKPPFKIGNIGPSVGPNSASMLEMIAGATLYFDFVNAQGGIKGRMIEFIQRNDDFEVPKTIVQAKKLVTEDKVNALLLVRGTPHNEAIMKIVDESGVPNIAPSTGAMSLHNPVKKNVFNVRAPYRYEAQRLAELLAILGKQRIVVVHTNDSFGEDVAQGIVAGLASTNLKPLGQWKFDRTKPEFVGFVPELNKLKPDAIVLIGAGAAVTKGIRDMRAAGMQAPVATVSNNASTGFIKGLGKDARGVMVSQVYPDERLSDMPVMMEARGIARKAGKQMSPAMMEGYMGAKVAVEALRACKNSCTHAELHAALEGLNVDLGGLRLAYSSKDHTGVEFTDLSVIDRDGLFKR